MSRKIRLWHICGIVALAFLIPGLAIGQEIPGALQAGMNVPAQAPEVNMSQDEKPITLEELKEMFGPRNVCGAPCGQIGQPHCFFLCGDGAKCYRGYCIYI